MPDQVDVFLPKREGGNVKHLVNFRTHSRCPFSRTTTLACATDGTMALCTSIIDSTLDALLWEKPTLRASVELIDSAASAKGTDIESIHTAYEARNGAGNHAHRRASIDRALVLAVPHVRSLMETRMRLRLYELGFPAPLVEPWLYDHDRATTFLGKPDLFYPQYRAALEYDGLGKLLNPSEGTSAEALIRHRHRSDRIASNDVWMIHVDSTSWKSGLWLDDVTAALKRKVDPFPDRQMRFMVPAWPKRFDTHPQWRWNLDK
ncbi:MAG: hypothetical protein SPI77_07385 [Corynebacterium sp.]|nr:hypothetical protein [Corynebacterium sp.]